MNPTPEKFDFLAWHDSIKEFAWWEDASVDYSWHLLETTKRAHAAKSKYWLECRMGRAPLDLTDLYEKVKILSLLQEQ